MRLLHDFIKPHFSMLAGLLCAAAILLLSLWNPIFIHTLHLKTYDLFLRHKLGVKADIPIVIVDIDDKSLAILGQWPWPRTVLAEILSHINKGNPKAIGLDIVLAESDRLSPRRIAATLKKASNSCQFNLSSLPDHDQALAVILKSTNTILGFPFTFSSSSVDTRFDNQPGKFAVIGADPKPWLFAPSSAVGNLHILEEAAAGSGFFNVLPDEDGIIRRLPLIMQYDGGIYPSLVLEMLRKGEAAADFQIFCTETGIEYVRSETYIIPTDEYGQMNIRFCGTEKIFPYISAVDIISGKINPSVFYNAYVLIGTSAKGLMDNVVTPTSVLFAGIEIHAHAINTILTGAYLREPGWTRGAQFVNLLVISILLILLIPKIGAIRSGILFLVTSGGVVFLSYWLFSRYGYFFDSIYPLLGNSLIFITLTFINYVQEEWEKQYIRDTFSKYLSPVLVSELLSSPEKLTLSGEEREVTVLFSDIRNFTAISEKISPQDVCRFLNQYFSSMAKILMDNMAMVDKFIGDAVYAFWNAPLYNPHHARHAIIAALLMKQALKDLNNNWEVSGLPVIHAGIGINTGTARIGNIGSEDRLSYTAIGDTVNLASRLEGLTKMYNIPIIVSAATYNKVKDQEFIFRILDKIRVAGKKRPTTVYELVDEENQVSPKISHEIMKYNEALAAYFKGEFKTALQLFQQLSDKNYNQLYKLFTQRCKSYLDNPPKEPWDGISTFISK